MKTSSENHIKSAAADRDTIIGSALSQAIAISPPIDACPSSEQLAVLVDGSATEAERETLLGHLAQCDRCREVYLLTHDLNVEEPVQQNHRGWYLAGGSLAAVALVLLAVKLTIQNPVLPSQQIAQAPVQQQNANISPVTPIPPIASAQVPTKDKTFSPATVVLQLAKAASADNLAAAIGSPVSAAYGFAGSGSQQATAFRAGKELFEVELWLAVGDKERAGLAAERLLPLLRDVRALDTTPGDLFRLIETGRVDDVVHQLEASFKSPHGEIIRLGSWMAAARLATETGSDPYFAGNPPQQFLKELDTTLSPSARETLVKLDKSRVGNNTVEIRRLLDALAVAI
ncbi:MAG: hypothetical protein JZU65_17420 [Chlorobium sp.]|nr:hypothetical protein [Chlorobium sp.]